MPRLSCRARREASPKDDPSYAAQAVCRRPTCAGADGWIHGSEQRRRLDGGEPVISRLVNRQDLEKNGDRLGR